MLMWNGGQGPCDGKAFISSFVWRFKAVVCGHQFEDSSSEGAVCSVFKIFSPPPSQPAFSLQNRQAFRHLSSQTPSSLKPVCGAVLIKMQGCKRHQTGTFLPYWLFNSPAYVQMGSGSWAGCWVCKHFLMRRQRAARELLCDW